MKPYHSHSLTDGRPRRRLPKSLLVAGVGGVLLVGYIAFSAASSDEKAVERERLETLDTPRWLQGELNRPTLPGGSMHHETEISVHENNDDPLHIIAKVERNQTLFVALRNRGLMPDRIQPVFDAMAKVFDFRKSRPGDLYEVRLDLDGNVLEFRYQTSPENIYTAHLEGDEYLAEKVEVPKETVVARIEGVVSSSLFQAFGDAGETNEIAQEFMDLFSYDFDFGSDSRQGDRFRLLAEKIYLDGEFYKYGQILVAEYTAGDRTFTAYALDEERGDGSVEYYDTEGRSLRRMFLKTPVRNVKTTSPFDRNRMHPILKRVRPHLGIDYAGPTGTPILAIADGVVTFVGWKGGNGNLVTIAHDFGYESVYAHCSRFARGLKKGDEIHQRDVIAFIGSTGLSTGPHLHFGMKKAGSYIDPLSIDTTQGVLSVAAKPKHNKKERDRLQTVLEGAAPINNGAQPEAPSTPAVAPTPAPVPDEAPAP